MILLFIDSFYFLIDFIVILIHSLKYVLRAFESNFYLFFIWIYGFELNDCIEVQDLCN
jgi:hypothetical protein